MLYEKYENDLKNILTALEYCNFDELEDEDNFYETVVKPFKQHYFNSYRVGTGASKGVLIFDDLNFVIKIPFKYAGGKPLCGAWESIEDWDYCGQEANRYIMALESGVEDVFLATELIKYINNYPIYIQELAEVLNDICDNSHSLSTKQDKDEIEKIIDRENFDYINVTWEADLYVYYGEEFYIKVKNFIEDKGISDLRSVNIGYIGKKPVIFDYASFDD